MASAEDLVEAGERLIAENGIDGVSMREIALEAGQLNNSAVTYHFGTKAGLVDAILENRMGRIDERRRAMLHGFETSRQDERSLLEALVFPLAEGIGHEDGVSWYARFLLQVVVHPEFELLDPARDQVNRGFHQVMAGLKRKVGRLPSQLRQERVDHIVNMAIISLGLHEQALVRGGGSLPTVLVASQIVDEALAMLHAPMSEETKLVLARAKRP